MSLQIEISERKTGLVEVALDGRLDTETSDQLEARLNELLKTELRAVDAFCLGCVSTRKRSRLGLR